MDYIQNIKKIISDKFPDFILSIFIYLIFLIIANIIRNILIKDKDDDNSSILDESVYKSKNLVIYQIANLTYYLILIIGVIFSIINLGFNVSTIITILASIGLAIGIAIQGVLGDVISGILLSFNNIFDINDTIRINNTFNENAIYGKVIDSNLYTTTLYDPTHKTILYIPNSLIKNNLITNISRSKLLYK
jgi:small-conductance mechanosensitive channel